MPIGPAWKKAPNRPNLVIGPICKKKKEKKKEEKRKEKKRGENPAWYQIGPVWLLA